MPIDPRMVAWDSAPTSGIDPRMVAWDEQPSFMQKLTSLGSVVNPTDWSPDTVQARKDVLAGLLRGAGSIGATVARPFESGTENDQRRKAMDSALQQLGADPTSWGYGTGKLGGEIAGTAGAGGVLARGASMIPALARLAPALETGGFNLGGVDGGLLGNAALRGSAGALQGGIQAGMVNPDVAKTGAYIGAAMPFGVLGAGKVGAGISDALDWSSKKLMQSALKPTIKQLRTGDAAIAVQTLLDEGLNATRGGVDALKGRISGLNDEIASRIANSSATVSKSNVLDTAWPTRQQFMKQVDPTPDLNAIDGVAERFYFHPTAKGENIPVQLAQELKQGTYQVLSKKYGQLGSADTEAQKALARGLKDEISAAVPEVAGLNAQESALIRTLGVTERRALMDMNKNPMGLAILAHNPASWAAFMLDKSALFKSLAARSVNAVSQIIPTGQGLLPNMIQEYGLLGAPSVTSASF